MNAELASLIAFINSTKVVVDPLINQQYTMVCMGAWPLIPFVHHDIEVQRPAQLLSANTTVNDEDWHVHVDYRFFDNSMIRLWKQQRPRGEYRERHLHVCFLQHCIMRGYPVVLKQLPCHHPSLGVPVDEYWRGVQHRLSATMPELEDSAANLKKLNCQRCPHKGFHFDSTNVKGGLLHCPMHGQKFKLNNGRWIKPPNRTPTQPLQ